MIIEHSFFQPVEEILNDLDNEQEDYREFRELDKEREQEVIDSIVRQVTGGFNVYEG